MGALFSEAWEIYKRRGLTLVCLILLTMVPFALLGAAFLLIHSLYPDMQRSVPLVAGIAVAGIVGICVVSFWAGTALIYAVTDETLTLREALGRSWPRLGSFIWLSLLMAFMIHGGIMLLLVPGLILMVWFLLGQFVLAEEDERGMNALLKSKAYVQGHFMDVALRLIAVTVIAVALGAVPVAGSLLSLLFTPFGVIFIFLVYRDLREIKGDLGFHPAKGEKWKWIGIAVLGYILPIIVVVGWLGANFFTTLNSMKSLLKQQAIPATSAQGAATMPVPGAVSGESGPVEAKPAVMTASEYDAVLNSAKVDFDSGTRCSVGPAAFLVRSFWDDARSPHFWLELKLAPLPNLELCGRNCVKVEIDSVINADDLNIYDSGNGLEGDFFRFLSLTRSETPEPHFMTLRDVHLKGGSKENDIQKVSGTLILKLPEKIETVTLDASSTGKEVGVAGAKVTLKEIAGKSVSFDYAGEYGRYLTTKAYDQGGKLLPDDGSSWNTEGDVTRQKNSYKGNVHSVKVLVASSMLERKYPFVVKR